MSRTMWNACSVLPATMMPMESNSAVRAFSIAAAGTFARSNPAM